MNLIVFNTLNSEDQLNASRYFLLRYLQIYNLKPPSGIGVRIFTKDLAIFDQYTSFFPNFELIAPDPDQMQSWQGPKLSAHRLSAFLLRDVLAEDTHQVLFIDGSVYPSGPLQEAFDLIEKDHLLLQEDPQEAASLSAAALESVLSSAQYPAPMEPNFNIMHAAVTGIGSRYQPMMDEVINLSDKLQGKLSKGRVNNLAFTKVFKTTGRLVTSPETLTHYRDLEDFNWLLGKFFQKNQEESIPGLVKSLHLISPDFIREKKQQFSGLPVYKKILQTLSGRKWSIREYEKRI